MVSKIKKWCGWCSTIISNSTTDKKRIWIGTKIVFEISKKDGQTAIKFTHEGLVPQYECYEICREAWTNYIKYSLRNLITTGQGEPSGKDHDDFNVQMVEKWKLDQ